MKKQQSKAATVEQCGTSLTESRPAPVSDGQQVLGNGQAAHADPLEMIQLRAYQKWEAAGKPRGNDAQFWLEAEREVLLGKK